MSRRYPTRRAADRKYFKRTAKKTKGINVVPLSGRGGIIM